jgi:interleukin-1 receptor-associated kinase 1/coatomer subunit beta'
VLDDGEEVAVKILHNNVSDSKDEEFKHEFDNLMMLRHPNIVRLVGYCFETQRQHMDFQGRPVFAETTCRALCFEYMHKGSLQGQLYGMMLLDLCCYLPRENFFLSLSAIH